MKKQKNIFQIIISHITNFLVKHIKLYRVLQNIFNYDLLTIITKKKDYKILINDHETKIRVFFPRKKYKPTKAIIYYHGGGFISGGITSYSKRCKRIAKQLNTIVILPEYRLSPEYKFPIPLNDCYMFLESLVEKDILNLHLKKYILMGDGAGANIILGVSYLAAKNKNININKQILICPVANYKHEDYKIFSSLTTYEKGCNPTASQMKMYLDYYAQTIQDKKDPLLAPLLHKSLKEQPKTLILTAEHDILKDEAVALKEKLKEHKIEVRYKCLENAYHNFYQKKSKPTKEANKIISKFL